MKNIMILVILAIGLSGQNPSPKPPTDRLHSQAQVAVSTATNPEIQKAIDGINQAYAAMPRLFLEMEYSMFVRHESSQAVEKQRGMMWKKEGHQCSQLGPIESLTTPEYVIYADHEDKELMLDRRRDTTSVGKDLFGLNLKTALQTCDTASLSDVAPGARLLRLDWPSLAVERVEIRFKASSHQVLKVSIYYAEEMEWTDTEMPSRGRMEIAFLKQVANPDFPGDLFSTDRFVIKSEHMFSPAPTFSGYGFFDTTNY